MRVVPATGPLTPALSPKEGEREQDRVPDETCDPRRRRHIVGHSREGVQFTRTGGDLVSTWVAKPKVHAEAQITS